MRKIEGGKASLALAVGLLVSGAPTTQAAQRGTPEQGSRGVERTMARAAGPPRGDLASDFNFAGPILTDSGTFTPDTMGAAGPSQFLVTVNGRFRSYDKATGLADGALNVDSDVFFAPVMTPVGGSITLNFTSHPRVRYDRLTQRWIIVMIDRPDIDTEENRVMIARSDGPVITPSTVWTFFYFENQDANLFADYPTLGVDANALYIGANMYTLAGAFSKTNMYVVRKSSILGAGPVVVTRFTGASGAGAGPFTPQGVDNFDQGAATGYFIGVDNAANNRLVVRTVSDPAGTPALSGNLNVSVPTTALPIDVDHLGNTGGPNGRLDSLDNRLLAAQLRGGHIWTAHNIGVNSSGGASSPTRTASRWYEVDVSGAPSLVQSGTLFDPGATPKNYWMPSVAVSGQNIMVIGGTVASAATRINTWFSSRLPSDPIGQLDTPTEYTASTSAYNPAGDPGTSGARRWGRYSFTSVDPEDDMTMWTIQEYAVPANNWGTRIARLTAPPPATPTSATPPTVTTGQASTVITVNGASTAASGFFDSGAGVINHMHAAVSCGITVNSATFVNPTTVELELNTTAAAGGPCDVTITNPDGQAATGTGLFTLVPPSPVAPLPDFASFASSPKSLRVSKKGRFTYTFDATPGRTGKVELASTKKVKVSAKKRKVKLASKGFTAPADGKVKVRFKLPAKGLKALKRLKSLSFKVSVTVGSTPFTARVKLKPPKRPKKR